MHELSVARSVIDLAVRAARDDHAERIVRIGVTVGAYSGVDAGALDSAFTVARLGTLAEEALLEIEPRALVCRCAGCRADFTVDGAHGVARCPRCDAISGDVREGMELEVRYIEVV